LLARPCAQAGDFPAKIGLESVLLSTWQADARFFSDAAEMK
jgi:hypothetical protein